MIYSALPAHPHTVMRFMTSSFTAAIPTLPKALGSKVSGASAWSCLQASVNAFLSSVAKFTLLIPRLTQSATSSSLIPEAPRHTRGMETTFAISDNLSVSNTGVPL